MSTEPEPVAPEAPTATTLPENAYRELKPGERYEPVVSPARKVAEVTVRSIIIGTIMGVLFSGASSFIALKFGQGIEPAIPIAILAVGLSALARRRSTLLENVNIVAIGATSGIIAGGSVFTMPALYVLKISHLSSFLQIFLVPLLGAVLGVLFLIPFRRYFVAEMHGKLPFPEATATTEALMAGERGGAQARVLALSLGVGFVFDFLVLSMKICRDTFTTAIVGVFQPLTDRVKVVFSMGTTAAILGLGYIIGVRYAAIILAGSMLSWFVLIPLAAHAGPGFAVTLADGKVAKLADLPADDIFTTVVRFIGIGAIFAAGLIGIIKMSPVIWQAFSKTGGELLRARRGRGAAAGAEVRDRTDRDIPMPIVLGLIAAVAVVLWLYFRFSVLVAQPHATWLTTVAVVVTLVIGFLFASVSAWAIAMIANTPISGMTLTTLIISALLMRKLGLSGPEGMLATLLIGGVVCTALSMTGSLVTQFKAGYWLGATPRSIEWSNILGSIVASVTVTAVIILLNQVYGFTPTPGKEALPAPQPNAMAAVLRSIMSGGDAPWLLYGLGAATAVIVEMLGVSSLAFALGMYLPLELNSPILVGAVVAHFVRKSGGADEVGRVRHERGTLVSSGLIAGGALAGVGGALVQWIGSLRGKPLLPDLGNTGPLGNWLGLGLFFVLCGWIYWDATRAKAAER
ncbi:MAG TPA: oligopeptide transporter, OPT family [Polyangia bacterium]